MVSTVEVLQKAAQLRRIIEDAMDRDGTCLTCDHSKLGDSIICQKTSKEVHMNGLCADWTSYIRKHHACTHA